MAKTPAFLTLGIISLDHTSSVPLYRQLYNALREAILSGQLAPGTRLPSTRALATELSLSRNTVVNGFEQLIAEGYLAGKVGAGTHVTLNLPDDVLQVHNTVGAAEVSSSNPPRHTLSWRGQSIARTPVTASPVGTQVRAFRAGLPALEHLPLKLWSRLVTRRLRTLPNELLGYGDPAGYRPLRQAIATYLGAARGVRCEPEQVIIVSGAQQALDLTARLLLDPEDAVWVENPGYLGARGAMLAANAVPIPIPVDEDGLDVQAGRQRCPQARLAYISPSHQYPLGFTMSLTRRLALLQWAREAEAWIIEDDYDSEYRYTGYPLASLQGLDRAGRVIYIGTFSKVLFPSLRLGYVVVPPDLVDAFVAARALTDRASPSLEQAALTDFITEGHFARHIRRMRTLYTERQAALVDIAQERLAGLLDINATPAGLHLVGWLPADVDDQHVALHLAQHGLETQSLSSFAMTPLTQSGLVLGYAAVSVGKIRKGVRQMEPILAELVRG